mmetsp:Transcript_73811/g.206207  ORF Transcript_73811/g.206207 Transcript_73811/m.206207 type:complete len:324 (-) Transcript_73811:1198-2169(-)
MLLPLLRLPAIRVDVCPAHRPVRGVHAGIGRALTVLAAYGLDAVRVVDLAALLDEATYDASVAGEVPLGCVGQLARAQPLRVRSAVLRQARVQEELAVLELLVGHDHLGALPGHVWTSPLLEEARPHPASTRLHARAQLLHDWAAGLLCLGTQPDLDGPRLLILELHRGALLGELLPVLEQARVHPTAPRRYLRAEAEHVPLAGLVGRGQDPYVLGAPLEVPANLLLASLLSDVARSVQLAEAVEHRRSGLVLVLSAPGLHVLLALAGDAVLQLPVVVVRLQLLGQGLLASRGSGLELRTILEAPELLPPSHAGAEFLGGLLA